MGGFSICINVKEQLPFCAVDVVSQIREELHCGPHVLIKV